MYYILHVSDSSPILEAFTSKAKMRKRLKDLKAKESEERGHWIDLAFGGEMEYIEPFLLNQLNKKK